MPVIRQPGSNYPFPWKRTTVIPGTKDIDDDPGYGKVRIPGARSLGDWIRSIIPGEYFGRTRRVREPPAPQGSGLTYNGLGTEYAFAPFGFNRAYPVYA
jgi:hypothetical protein